MIVAPTPLADGAAGAGRRRSADAATEVARAYRALKDGRRLTDLTREKYLIHIDGEGDGQYADVLNGSMVRIPPNVLGGLRFQHNFLRPMTENAVAYHTSQDFEVIARAAGDRESRDRARIDTIWANDQIHRQSLNVKVAEALFFAAAYGHCPIHAVWRTDTTAAGYEPLYATEALGPEGGVARGYVDYYVGDPWATVYNPGAKRYSVQWLIYARDLPLAQVQNVFGDRASALKGRTDVPSVSRFQRTVRKWLSTSSAHGTAAVEGVGQGEQEIVTVLCREDAPGTVQGWPEGRLTVVGVSGAAQYAEGGPGSGTPVLLHEGPLPAGRLGMARFYMSGRCDDVLGKPYVADLDDLQVKLNQLVTNEVEYARRWARPPLLVEADSLVDDTITTEDDAIIEVVAGASGLKPGFLYPSGGGIGIFDGPIRRTEEAMFRIGGWQAASRGESSPGDPAAKVIALAQADDTVFGPMNRGVKRSLVELLQIGHALARRYMTIPSVVSVTGEDMAYMAAPYIERTQLSDEPPDFAVVSGMGATPESRARQLLGLATTVVPPNSLLSRDQVLKLWPDRTLVPTESMSEEMRQQRVGAILYAMQRVGRDLRQKMGPMADRFLFQAHQQLMAEYPPLPDDLLPLHIDGYSQLTQDEAEDPLVRRLATLRQQQYMAMMQPQAPGAPGPRHPTAGPGPAGRVGRGAAPLPIDAGGNAPALQAATREVPALTRRAQAGAI